MTYIPDDAILRSDEITPSAYRLYSFYCMHRNSKTGGWDCSLSQSAAETKMSKSRVSELRAELEAKKWIEVEGSFITPVVGFKGSESRTPPFEKSNPTVRKIEPHRSKNRTKCSRSRTLPPDPPNKDYQINTNNTCPLSAFADVSSDSFSLTPPPTKTEIEESKSKPKAQAKAPTKTQPKSELRHHLPLRLQQALTPEIEADALEVFQHWQTAFAKPTAKFTKDRVQRVVGVLVEGYTKQDLLGAIKGCKQSPYHQGQNDTRTVYNDLELICRSGQKVEQFMGYCNLKPGQPAPVSRPVQPTPAPPATPPPTESDIARRIAALTESGTIVTGKPARLQQTREYYEARMGFAELYRALSVNPEAIGMPAVEEVLAFGIEHGVFASNHPEFAQMRREVFGRWLLWQHRNEIAARNAFARALEHPKYVAQVLARYGVSPAAHGQEVACA